MAKIGALTVDLKANTAGWSTNLNKAASNVNSLRGKVDSSLGKIQRKFSGLGRSLKGVIGQFVSLRSAIGLALGSGALGVLSRNVLGRVDRIGKVADSIGLSVEALQEYRYAAELAGLTTEKFDSAAQAFAKRLGELRSGTGTLLTFLKKYDEQLLKQIVTARSTDQALTILLNKLGEIGSASDRAALAAAAFGRTAGVDMTNLVRNGADEVTRLRQSARDLGIVLSEEVVRSAEETNDRLTTLQRVAGAELARAVVQAGPALVEMTRWIAKVGGAAIKAANEVLKFLGAFSSLEAKVARAKVKKDYGTLFDNIRKSLGAPDNSPAGRFTRKRLEQFEKETAAIVKRNEEMKRVKNLQQGYQSMTEAIYGRPGQVVKLDQPNIDWKKLLGGSTGSKGGSAAKKREKELDRMAKAETRFLDRVNRDWLRSTEQKKRLLEEERDAQLKKAEEIIKSETALAEAKLKINETYAARIRELQEREAGGVKKIADLMVDVGQRVSDLGLEAIDIFTSKSKDKMEQLREAVIATLRDIRRMIWQTFVTPLFKQVGKNFGGIFDKALGSLLGTSSGGGLGMWGAFADAAFQHGGSFTVGGRGGTDANLVSFRASKGEQVTVTPPGGGMSTGSGAGGGTVINVDLRYSNGSEEIERRIDRAFRRNIPGIVQTSVVKGDDRRARRLQGTPQTA